MFFQFRPSGDGYVSPILSPIYLSTVGKGVICQYLHSSEEE